MINILIAGALLLTAQPLAVPRTGKITIEYIKIKEDDIYELQLEKFEQLKEEVVTRRREEEIISARATKKKQAKKLTSTELPVCAPLTNIVTWMDYRANKNPKAPQTQIQRTGDVVTAKDGTRYTDGYLHVAMAMPYGNIGDKFIINFEGTDVPVILVEWKGNTSCQHPDGSMIELVIDSTVGTNVSAYQRRINKITKVN